MKTVFGQENGHLQNDVLRKVSMFIIHMFTEMLTKISTIKMGLVLRDKRLTSTIHCCRSTFRVDTHLLFRPKLLYVKLKNPQAAQLGEKKETWHRKLQLVQLGKQKLDAQIYNSDFDVYGNLRGP